MSADADRRPRWQQVRPGALAARLASVGFDVVVGSRSKYRAMEVRDALLEKWAEREPLHRRRRQRGRRRGRRRGHRHAVGRAPRPRPPTVAKQLRGKVVISMANALAKVGHEFQPLVPPRGSVAASVQAAVPRVARGRRLPPRAGQGAGRPHEPVESDVLICSDHPSATETTIDIVAKIPNLRPLDAGELSNAAPIEAFAAVLLQLNVRYKTRVAVRFTGIDPEQS